MKQLGYTRAIAAFASKQVEWFADMLRRDTNRKLNSSATSMHTRQDEQADGLDSSGRGVAFVAESIAAMEKNGRNASLWCTRP